MKDSDVLIWHFVECPREDRQTLAGKEVTNLKSHVSKCKGCKEPCEWSWMTEDDLKDRLKKAEDIWNSTKN